MPWQRLTIALCVLIISLCNSCRISKEVTATGGVSTLKSEQEFFITYTQQLFQYKSLSARIQFELKMSSGNSASSRAQLKILKDDKLQISIQPLLGIEALRAEITPDSIKIVNRLNRWYMVDAFDNIKGDMAIDFNFYNLQALLTNRLFLPGEATLADHQLNLFSWEQTANGYIMRTNDHAGLHYTFIADTDARLCATEINDTASSYAMDCNYKNFRAVDQQLFPMDMLIRLHTEDRAQHTLSFQFSRVEVDVPLETNFPVPANYQRVSLQQILHSIELL